MSDTHPNALRMEAEGERKQASLHANRANELDQQAQKLEDALSATDATSVETNQPKEEPKEEKKLFKK